MPTGTNLTLTAQESATSAIGTFSFTTTGSLVGACSATTPTLTGVGGVQSSTPCSNTTTPFALQTVSSYTLAGGTQLNTTTTTLVTNVPEPASIMMFGSGLLGFAGVIRRKLNK
jgi:hypothetical protein